MASSAFRSTTRRTLHASDDRRAPRKAPSPCPRRSRSVSAAPRSRALARGGDLEEYANTRTNPLFDCGTSPSPALQQHPGTTSCGGGEVASRERGREVRKGCAGSGRARSASVAPQRRRTALAPSTGTAGDGGKRISRPRSVAGDTRPCRGSNSEHEQTEEIGKIKVYMFSITWYYFLPVPGGSGSPSPPKLQLSITSNWYIKASSKMNHSAVPVELVLEIPPEFDPDSAEFVSYISDYATEFNNEDTVEIPLEFDPDAAKLVSEEWHHAIKMQWEQMEIPLEFDPDSAELAPDITEYTTKLKQSHLRARKLRADLAVEEQREQELSRMLKGIVTVPSSSETHKKRPRRKSSMERLKVSRHLAEEAMNYFEECVSISTLDSTDFSSLEDPQPNSVVTVLPKGNSRFLHKGGSSLLEPHFPTDRRSHHEESDNQTQCSISITGSDVSDSVIFSHTKAPGLANRNNSSDDLLDGFDTPRSRSSCFSFTHEPAKTVENCDVRQYLRSFGRGISKELREMRSSYCADDYVFQKVSEDLLTDIVTFKNRIEYGGLLICNIRTI